jgi:hypothetical protein
MDSKEIQKITFIGFTIYTADFYLEWTFFLGLFKELSDLTFKDF